MQHVVSCGVRYKKLIYGTVHECPFSPLCTKYSLLGLLSKESVRSPSLFSGCGTKVVVVRAYLWYELALYGTVPYSYSYSYEYEYTVRYVKNGTSMVGTVD